jgi:nucleotidyltransferase substrate binding protein (TIGR01987 family)
VAVSQDELIKAIKSLSEAITLYHSSAGGSLERKAFRDACIQRFEYCIELCWKVSVKVLGSTTAAAKPAIREMARNNLIADPNRWIDFIEARNNTSHSYDEEVAAQVFSEIEAFLPFANELLVSLKKLNK